MNKVKVFAAFAISTRVHNGHVEVAATTRPDRSIGLPGGKLEPCDRGFGSLAAHREAGEEGWELGYPDPIPMHKSVVDGRVVEWYYFPATGYAKSVFKEMGRIKPIWVPIESIKGFGNEAALASIKCNRHTIHPGFL